MGKKREEIYSIDEIILLYTNLKALTQTTIYTGLALLIGFIWGLAIHILQSKKAKKSQNSLEGFLESEKLIKERLQKENTWLHVVKKATEEEYEMKIQELEATINRMDEDILLLQKDNEETQALLQVTQPVVHALKIKLLEANNTIARFKSQPAVK